MWFIWSNCRYRFCSQFQKLSELIAKVAERKSIDAETIFLMLNGKIVAPSSSLRSIDYIPGLVICKLWQLTHQF